jgi:methylated-DNA-[protein]-cysteine S-methyltransferase
LKEFRFKVYDLIKKIPAGKVTTYKEVARSLNISAYRAIGGALSKNPFAPEVPCHRVVKSNGDIGGYSARGGIKTKIKLLKDEGVCINKNNKIENFEKNFYSLSKKG